MEEKMKINFIQIDYHYQVIEGKKEYMAQYCKPTKGKPRFEFYECPDMNAVINVKIKEKIRKLIMESQKSTTPKKDGHN